MKTNFYKFTCLIFLFTFICFASEAQFSPAEIEKKGLIGISYGPSFPMGDFASTSMTSTQAGFATTGTIFDINFAYTLGKNTGISILYRSQSHPIEEDAFSVYSAWGLPVKIEAGNWKSNAILAGLYITVPTSFTKKTYFDGRVLIGYASTSSPELKFTVTNYVSNEWIKQESGDASTAILVFGGGFHFNVSDIIAIQTNADFSFLTADYSNVLLTSSSGTTELTDFSQPMSTFNLSAGIAFRL